MANTFTLWVQAKAFVAGGVMAGIMNTHATKILKIRRVGLINNQTAAVTGVVCAGELRYYTGAGWAAPTAVTPISHDSTNGALSGCTAGHSGTPSGSSYVIRRYLWSSDEPKLTTAQNNEWECLIPLNIIWDAGYGDSNVQPLTLRQNESFIIYNVTGAAGLVDIWIEFTEE